MLLLSAYGGLIADRFDKRLILKITQAWLALCAAVLGHAGHHRGGHHLASST